MTSLRPTPITVYFDLVLRLRDFRRALALNSDLFAWIDPCFLERWLLNV